MKMDLETLARIVEEQVSTARATCVPKANQIVVAFTNRPDVELALLTPWLQKMVSCGEIEPDELQHLISELVEIGGFMP